MAQVKFGKVTSKTEEKKVAPVIEGEVVEGFDSATPATQVQGVSIEQWRKDNQPQAPVYADVDDGDIADVRFPKLNVAHNTGEIGKHFPPGIIGLNMSPPGQFIPAMMLPLTKEPPKIPPVGFTPEKLRCVFIGFSPSQWWEKVPQGVTGERLGSEEEVYNFGGTTVYKDSRENKQARNTKPLFREQTKALLLVEMPETLSEEHEGDFPFVADGKRYAVATLNCIGVVFKNVAVIVKGYRSYKQFRDREDPNPRSTGSFRNRFIDLAVRLDSFKEENKSTWALYANPPGPRTSQELRDLADMFLPQPPSAPALPAPVAPVAALPIADVATTAA